MKERKKWRLMAAVICVLALICAVIWQQHGEWQNGIGLKKVTDNHPTGKQSDIVQLQKVSYPEKKEESMEAGYLSNLKEFYQNSIRETLTSEKGENRVYSPVNLYLCMAMLTEMTDGRTKEQLMNALGQTDGEKVREQSQRIWQNVYMDNKFAKCTLGNSIWLNQDVSYQEDVLKTLAENYYTETFQGQMGTKMDQRIQSWVNDMTGNQLEKESGEITTDARTVFMLLSTAYFYDQWITPFLQENTKEDTFTNADGKKISCDFMNAHRFDSVYQTERFQAASLGFENGNSMLLILPEKGTTVEDLLKEDMEEILHISTDQGDGFVYGDLTLSLPKFTISSNLSLIPVMENMGVTDLFDIETADFTKLLEGKSREENPVFVNKVQQASKAAVDENGCSVASFTEVELKSGAAMPQEKFVIDCDHPFLFIINNYDGVPVFAGVVNQM